MFGVLIVLLGLTNIYTRTKNKWSKLHYPLSYRYAQAIGYVMGSNNNESIEYRVQLALEILAKTIYPDLDGLYIMQKVIQFNNSNFFTDREIMKKVLLKLNPNFEDVEKNVDRLINSYKLDEESGKNSLIVSNFYAHVIFEKYGEETLLDYIWAVLNRRAV